MPKRLFQFRAVNGSGKYRAQVVHCDTGAVLSVGGYSFDIPVTGQPTSGLVSLLFDNIPVGTLIPAGYRLKVTDQVDTSAIVYGVCSPSAIIVCAPVTNCSITALTHSVSSACDNAGKFTTTYGFTVTSVGDYVVELLKYQTGQLLAQKNHTATTVGVQAGTIPLPATGLLPGTGILLRVRSSIEGTCTASDLDHLLTLPETWTSIGSRYHKGADCAAIQQGTCSATFRVVAVDCVTGAVLDSQPDDWPLQSVSLEDLQDYLAGKGYSTSTVITAPVLVCGFGNIKIIGGVGSARDFTIPTNTFSGQNLTYELYNATTNENLTGSFVVGKAALQNYNTDPTDSTSPIYARLFLNEIPVGTTHLKLRAKNGAGQADYLFDVIAQSNPNLLHVTIRGFVLTASPTANLTINATGSVTATLTQQGDCATSETHTGSSTGSGLTHSLAFSNITKGLLYNLALQSGTGAVTNVTVAIPNTQPGEVVVPTPVGSGTGVPYFLIGTPITVDANPGDTGTGTGTGTGTDCTLLEEVAYYINTVGTGGAVDSIGFYYKGTGNNYKFYIESETVPDQMELYDVQSNHPTVSLSGGLARFNHRVIQAMASRVWHGHAYKVRLEILVSGIVVRTVNFSVDMTQATGTPITTYLCSSGTSTSTGTPTGLISIDLEIRVNPEDSTLRDVRYLIKSTSDLDDSVIVNGDPQYTSTLSPRTDLTGDYNRLGGLNRALVGSSVKNEFRLHGQSAILFSNTVIVPSAAAARVNVYPGWVSDGDDLLA